MAASHRRIRVMRVIARMNVGGPAKHVALLSAGLDPARYETLLVHGQVGPGEKEVYRPDHVRTLRLASLGPRIRPPRDVRAAARLAAIAREFRPDIVHTHTAKAGFLGRGGARIGAHPPPIIVHTFHGHVLEGYFGPTKSFAYRRAERALARLSDCLIGVSAATVADLVRLGVASPSKFRVIEIGLELGPFLAVNGRGHGLLRREVDADDEDVLVAYVGRLVPIKRVDLLIQAVKLASANGPRIRLAVIGDGNSRAELESLTDALGVREQVRFLGYRLDVSELLADADMAALSSANEGIPVSLVEAGAAGRPIVATAVGGVPDVVPADGGRLVSPNDPAALAAALRELAIAGPDVRARIGERARRHVRERFSAHRLLREISDLYEELLSRQRLRGDA